MALAGRDFDHRLEFQISCNIIQAGMVYSGHSSVFCGAIVIRCFVFIK